MMISSMSATVLLGSLIMLPLPNERTEQVKPNPVSVTGCLKQGDEANEFVITTRGGKKYEITSKSVSLSGHVGHMVTVKGTVVAEEKGENEAKEERNEKGEKGEAHENEGEHLQVTQLTMVSPKCQ
jgi:hypothetical protein